jgi:hypothetical protein
MWQTAFAGCHIAGPRQSGAQVIVTGTSGPPTGQSDFATVAYQS